MIRALTITTAALAATAAAAVSVVWLVLDHFRRLAASTDSKGDEQ